MKKIILDLAVTLDGFIEGPNGEIDWCVVDEEPDFENSEFGEFLSGIDTIFYGRVSYDLWGNYEPEENAGAAMKSIFASVHSKTKYVFSATNHKSDKNAIYLNSGSDSTLQQQVEEIKRQPGKDIWLYGGAKLITTFINLDLVDVYRLAVHPVILGAGKPLFANIAERKCLKLTRSSSWKSGVVILVYEQVEAG
jgi:dihydrofolate reductase